MMLANYLIARFATQTYEKYVRPENPKFSSELIEDRITSILNSHITDKEFPAELFENCFAYTTDNLVTSFDDNATDTAISTGDIPAMWLRDSSAEVAHLFPLVVDHTNSTLARMLEGLVMRQARSVLDYQGYSFRRRSYQPTESLEYPCTCGSDWNDPHRTE